MLLGVHQLVTTGLFESVRRGFYPNGAVVGVETFCVRQDTEMREQIPPDSFMILDPISI